MNSEYKSFRDKAFSALHLLAKESPEYEDAQMLIGSSESKASLSKNSVFKNIDTDWIDAIEKAIPALDIIIRKPSVAIEDIDEILPVEVSRHITEKSIKHLAQHTNLILDIKDDEVTPQKILNVYHDETYLTYENKFVNTLLARLAAFVDKRYRALADGRGTEKNYKFDYLTEFEHHLPDDGGKNSARIRLSIELTSPLDADVSELEANKEIDEKYRAALERVERINRAVASYQASAFANQMGRNYIRPPVIRTNAILKNKDLKECLTLWEYIESFDRVGYSVHNGEEKEMPSEEYISDLHSSVALQYVNFYNGVTQSEENRLLSKKRLFDITPDFSSNINEEELDDFLVYDSEYKKLVPISRLMNNRKKLSEDEKRISDAISIALKADEIIEERRRAEEEAKKRAELEAKLRAEREAKRIADLEARRAAKEEEKRLAKERAEQLAAEEAKRKEEQARFEAEEAEREEKRKADEEKRRRAYEEYRRMVTEAAEKEAEERLIMMLADLLFFPDDGNLEGRRPACPYTRLQYLGMARKKKKQVKIRMNKVVLYREAQKRIAELDDNSKEKSELIKKCEDIRNSLFSEKWQTVLNYNTVKDQSIQ